MNTKGRLVALIIHADDFGITVEQSKAILELSDACGGHGALSSMSMFANSPAFNECAELVRPFVDAGKIKLGLHLNIVEGHPVSNPDDVPLLVNERGTFSHSFMGYLMASTLRTSVFRRERIHLSMTVRAQSAGVRPLGAKPSMLA